MKAVQYRKLLQELCKILKEGVHIVDSEGITIIYNEAMAALEDTEREDVISKSFREIYPNIPEDESTFVRAIKRGIATEDKPQTYLNKNGKEISVKNSTYPVFDYDKNLIAAIEIAHDITDIKTLSNAILEMQAAPESTRPSAPAQIKKYYFNDIAGKSKIFLETLQKAQKAATGFASVLISGETGTGKEMFAQSIHYAGDRQTKPFLAQNCAALPENLLEGILFGTSKGGFTGAIDRQGLFEQADGGTLLLDELSAMPYILQSKLLRVLQENYVRRIGGAKDIPIDVRVIATLNEDPELLIESGRLRKDLYYRLKVIEIVIPPLRERPEDVPVLADIFLNKYNKKFDKQIWMLADGAKSRLLAYDFPGNVRELENIIMSAVALSGATHVLSENALDLPVKAAGFDGIPAELKKLNGVSLNEYIGVIENRIIKQFLADNGGNISKTAKQLGIQRQALQYKLRKKV